LKETDTTINQVCENIIKAIPPGWQYPEICVARITLEGMEYKSLNFEETPWLLSANIVQQDQVVGTINVYYLRQMPTADIGPFLKEEKKLIETIADRLNYFLAYSKMKHLFKESRVARKDLAETGIDDWETVLDLVRQTDNALFLRISNKMLNHLCWSGIEEAEALRREERNREVEIGESRSDEAKKGNRSRVLDFSSEFTEKIFRIAAEHLSNDTILSRIQMWIQEDKLVTLLRTVRRRLPLSQVFGNLRRYFFTTRDETYTRYPLARGLKVLLIESILSNRLDYIKIARDYVDIEDLYQLLQRMIFSNESHGKLGGKGADLFLASQVLRKTPDITGFSSPPRKPRTWYISSDMMLEFLHYNNMDDAIEQKYKDIERVRLEYPNVLDMFQQADFPPEMVSGLSAALDDFDNSPIIVRSSSLLEDRTGFAFVNKYKSVFLANQGSREERLQDLKRAVAEIYASNFAPEPIEYRAKHSLLEFSEQMGIMIQEVVGTRVGPYFLPAYSGIALSRNYLQVTFGHKSNSGFVHIIPGLWTRTTIRNGEEHPVAILPDATPYQSDGSAEDSARHAPRKIDVINLETNNLQTVDVNELFENFGDQYPGQDLILSVNENGHIRQLDPDREKRKPQRGNFVVTFDGLVKRSPFIARIKNLLRILEEKFGMPVEIEFSSDGENLYLLQCRPQFFHMTSRSVKIPEDIPEEQLVFSSRPCASNGHAFNITHIVYLDPEAHEKLKGREYQQDILRVLGELNRMLPGKQFVLICAGRWSTNATDVGGIEIKHCDIGNTAALIELSKAGQSGVGILSADVHFLSDIRESNMILLPIMPDDEATFLNKQFILRSVNILPELLPEYAYLSDVIRVIDLPDATEGMVMQVIMNAEQDRAIGLLADAGQQFASPAESELLEEEYPENYCHWRCHMAEKLASQIDPEKSGVVGVYLFGSTKNGTAGPASPIDILIHFRGMDDQRDELVSWLEGWSLCLDEINYLRTGYRSGGLLNFHIVTDEDIKNKTSFAVKIDAVTGAARPLRLKEIVV
jgi:hypothetical protein